MISIQLDDPKGYFLSGETVTGRVLFSVEFFTGMNFDLRCLTKATLLCKGEADVSFHKVKYALPFHLKASEEIFKITIPLSDVPPATNDDGKWNHLVPDKQYSCPFSFDLPASSPSSVEGRHGRVRFTLKAKIAHWSTISVWPGSDKTERTKIPFPVVKLVDLNVNPLAKMPVSVTASKNLFDRTGQNGPFTVKAWLNKSGYVPGEILYLNGEVENFSGKTMMGTAVQLIQVIKYRAKGADKFTSRVVREATHGSFDRTDIWSNVPFLIPFLPPTDEGFYNLIQISYRIEFVIDPGLNGSRFTVPMEVIIGTVPLSSDPDQKAATIIPLGDVHPLIMYEDCPVTEETADVCLMSFASTDDTGALLD